MKYSILSIVVILLSVISVYAQKPITVIHDPGAWGWNLTGVQENGIERLVGTAATRTMAEKKAAEILREAAQSKGPFKLVRVVIQGDDWNSDTKSDKRPSPKEPTLAERIEAAIQQPTIDKSKIQTLDLLNVALPSEMTDSLAKAAAGVSAPNNPFQDAIEALKSDKPAINLGSFLLNNPNVLRDPKGELNPTKVPEVSTGLKDYMNAVALSYEMAKLGKEQMLSRVDKITDKAFGDANKLIAGYNAIASNPPKAVGVPVGLIPKIEPLGPKTAERVNEWMNAQSEQFALERQKLTLDKRHEQLEAERIALQAEWAKLSANGKPDPADPVVIRLRDRARKHREQADEYLTAVESHAVAVSNLDDKMHLFAVVRIDKKSNPKTTISVPPKVVADDIAMREKYIGKWNVAQGNTELYIRFNADGTGCDGFDGFGQFPAEIYARFTWVFKGEYVEITYSDKSTGTKRLSDLQREYIKK